MFEETTLLIFLLCLRTPIRANMMLINKIVSSWWWVRFSCCYGNCSSACEIFGDPERKREREKEVMPELEQTFLLV